MRVVQCSLCYPTGFFRSQRLLITSNSNDHDLDLSHDSSEFKSLVMPVNSQLVYLRLVGILNNVIFNLNLMSVVFGLLKCRFGYSEKSSAITNSRKGDKT